MLHTSTRPEDTCGLLEYQSIVYIDQSFHPGDDFIVRMLRCQTGSLDVWAIRAKSWAAFRNAMCGGVKGLSSSSGAGHVSEGRLAFLGVIF